MNQEAIFDLSNIPEVWGIATLDEIARNERNAIKRGPFGSAIKKSFFVPNGYKVYEQKNVIYNDFRRGSYYISDEKFNELESFKVKAGDILMSCSGTVGRLAIVPSDFEEGIINQALLKITLNNNIIYNRFFFYLFGFNISRILQKNTRGSAMLNISSVRDLKNIQFPIPPLPEQQRIVAKIEELFTKLDAGVEALRQVQVQLKRYRQSVLKAAVEGRLTAEWRKQNKDGLEPANQLMKRIQEERKAKLGKKYKEPIPVDTLDMPELPEGWVVSSVGSLYDIVGGGTPSTKVSEYWDGDNPWITSADISGQGKISPRKSITQEGIENSATNLVPKNSLVVVTRVGLGKVALTDFLLCFSQDSQALIGSENYINPKFAFYYLLRTVQIFKYRSRGTTISGVTKKQLFELPFSIPPYQEQQEIITRIESIYSAIDACDLIIKSELKRTQSLQQSILKRAFEGKLVPQDPNDEPASVLLERIKAEKAKLKKFKQMEMF